METDRPLTRFLVMADAENKYETAGDRREQRKLLLEALTKNVPKDLRSDYYVNTRRDRIVEIWTRRRPFEFADFTDTELTDAMFSIAIPIRLRTAGPRPAYAADSLPPARCRGSLLGTQRPQKAGSGRCLVGRVAGGSLTPRLSQNRA